METPHGTGPLRDTDARIVSTLRMDYDTFTNASFFLQGKADQFAVARPGDRKQILSNILGLEIWETYREAAGIRRRNQEKEVRELDGRLTEIHAELDEGPQRKSHLQALETQLAELAGQREQRAEILDNVRRLQTALEEQRKLLTTLQSQRESAERNLERLQATLTERKIEQVKFAETLTKAKAIEAAYKDWQTARQALEAMEEVAEQFRKHEALRHEPLAAIRAEAARLSQEKEGLEAQQAALEKAGLEKDKLAVQLGSAREKMDKAKASLAAREELENAIRKLQADQAEAKAENPRLRDEMLELKARIDQLQVDNGVECPLCGQPLSGDDRQRLVGSLSEKGTALGDRFRDNKQLLESFEGELQKMGSQLADLKGVEVELRETTRQVDQLESQLAALKETAKTWEAQGAPRLTEINQLLAEETFAAEARQKLTAIDAELEALGYDLEAHDKLRKTEQAGREAEADLRALEQARAALAPIEREIDGLETQLQEQDTELGPPDQSLRRGGGPVRRGGSGAPGCG